MKQSSHKLSRLVADQTLKSGLSRRFNKEVAAYLLGQRRTSELDSVLRDVQADWAAAGYVEVLAASAHPLTATLKTDIRQRLKGLYPNATRIVVTEVLDPSVIGGVRLSLPNRQLDLTVEAKLNRFKQLTTSGKD